MSEHMKKEIEEINAKPEFYIDGRVIVKQGRGKYNEETGTGSLGLSYEVCEVLGYISEPKAVLNLMNAGHRITENAAVCLTVIGWVEELLKEVPASPIAQMVADGLPKLKAAVQP